MFQNDLLDLAIGLVFVWFILSLVISAVNEGVVLVFRVRAKHLGSGSVGWSTHETAGTRDGCGRAWLAFNTVYWRYPGF